MSDNWEEACRESLRQHASNIRVSVSTSNAHGEGWWHAWQHVSVEATFSASMSDADIILLLGELSVPIPGADFRRKSIGFSVAAPEGDNKRAELAVQDETSPIVP